MKTPTKKRKGKQPGVNSLVEPGVQNSLGDDPRRAFYNSMNCIQKYKRIEKRIMQFMWKKGIRCIVQITQPEKEKGLFMIMILLLRLTTCKPYCTDKFIFLALRL